MTGDIRVFTYKAYGESAVFNANFAIDTPFGNIPTTFWATGENDANYMHHGVLNRVYWNLTPANAVTYRLSLWEGVIGASGSLEQLSALIFDSEEVTGAGVDCAITTTYDAHELVRPFRLYDESGAKARLLYYALDWSAAPGSVYGMISCSGRREAFASV